MIDSAGTATDTKSAHPDSRNISMWPLLAGLLIVCFIIYASGLLGGFLFDDFPNIVDKPELRAVDGSLMRWLALATSSNAGMLRRPISMLSFGIDYVFFGLNPLAFKSTNLLIHLANGLVIYKVGCPIATRLTERITRSAPAPEKLALFAAALWLLHPLNVSTVVYVVQRMDELATFFILLGLVAYVTGRQRMLRGEPGMAVAFSGVITFGILATLSKENGALITGYAFIVELFCYRFAALSDRDSRIIKAFFWVTVALPIALFLGYLLVHPQWLTGGYVGRDFTLYQRLLSEARILCRYLLWILVPYPGWMGVYHDDIAVSTGLLHPVTTLASLVFLMGLGVATWRLRRRVPALAFGLAWFLVGHSMESTIFPLELAFDHRNYLPMAGLLLGLTCTVAPWTTERLKARTTMTIGVAIIALLAAITATWTYAWGSPLRLAKFSVAHHPTSARAQYEAGRQIIFEGTAEGHREQAEQQAMPYFEHGMRDDSTDVYSASSLILIHGRHAAVVPPEAVSNLAWRLRHMLQPQINPFLVVMTAAIRGELQLSHEQMEQLVDAALANPRLTHSMRAMVLNNYGHYLFQIAHDNQAAVSLTMAAAAEDSTNPLFEINLTRLAIALGDAHQARAHLLRAKQLDNAKLYDSTIEGLERQLDSQ